jgi:hypothetical protein
MPTTIASPTPANPSPDVAALFPLKIPPPLAAQCLDCGTHEMAVYLLGATHLRDFLKPIGVTAWKAGVTGCREAERRAEDCRRKKYASILKRPADAFDPGRVLNNGHEWFVVPVQEGWLGGKRLPTGMSIRDGVIRLTMPTAVTVVDVDRALHDILRPRSLNVYLDSPDGRKRLLAAGYDPKARLHTSYTLMTPRPRLSLAEELYLIRPQRELFGLVKAIDAVAASLRTETKATAR